MNKNAVFHLLEEEEEAIGAIIVPRPRAFSFTNSFTEMMKSHAKLLVLHIDAVNETGTGVETKNALDRQLYKWKPAFMNAYRNKDAFEKFRKEMLLHIDLFDKYLKRTKTFYVSKPEYGNFTKLRAWEDKWSGWLTKKTRPLRGDNLDAISKSLTTMVTGGNKFVLKAKNPLFPGKSPAFIKRKLEEFHVQYQLTKKADIRDAWSFHGLCTARYATARITGRTELYDSAKEACLEQAKQVGAVLDSMIKKRIKA